MPEYWFVVNPDDEALFQALTEVLGHKAGFHVIKERRVERRTNSAHSDRRTAHVWQRDALHIARTSPGD